jgi:hypothetical protein
MAGSMSKANQRQSQKRKNKGGNLYGMHRIRMREIPLVCSKGCEGVRTVPSQQAYISGGNKCGKCGARMLFSVHNFPRVQLQKR